MKTNYSRVWGMQDFHTCICDISNSRACGNNIRYPYIILFKNMRMRVSNIVILDIYTYKSYVNYITETYIINQILGINYSQKGTRITPTSVPSNVSVGEWRRRNERIGR